MVLDVDEYFVSGLVYNYLLKKDASIAMVFQKKIKAPSLLKRHPTIMEIFRYFQKNSSKKITIDAQNKESSSDLNSESKEETEKDFAQVNGKGSTVQTVPLKKTTEFFSEDSSEDEAQAQKIAKKGNTNTKTPPAQEEESSDDLDFFLTALGMNKDWVDKIATLFGVKTTSELIRALNMKPDLYKFSNGLSSNKLSFNDKLISLEQSQIKALKAAIAQQIRKQKKPTCLVCGVFRKLHSLPSDALEDSSNEKETTKPSPSKSTVSAKQTAMEVSSSDDSSEEEQSVKKPVSIAATKKLTPAVVAKKEESSSSEESSEDEAPVKKPVPAAQNFAKKISSVKKKDSSSEDSDDESDEEEKPATKTVTKAAINKTPKRQETSSEDSEDSDDEAPAQAPVKTTPQKESLDESDSDESDSSDAEKEKAKAQVPAKGQKRKHTDNDEEKHQQKLQRITTAKAVVKANNSWSGDKEKLHISTCKKRGHPIGIKVG